MSINFFYIQLHYLKQITKSSINPSVGSKYAAYDSYSSWDIFSWTYDKSVISLKVFTSIFFSLSSSADNDAISGELLYSTIIS
ncbi:MAG: hypothetical protein U9N10_05955 [Bacillota bacterium]|nr:hypothetical protein [Bacillota bacterium]